MSSSYMQLSILFSLSGSSHVSGVGYHRLSFVALGSWNNWLITLAASSGNLVINVSGSLVIG